MRASIRFLVWRGIVIGAHWSLLVIAWLLAWSLAADAFPRGAPGYSDGEYWVAGIVTSVAFLASIAAHELGHAVVALRRGISVSSITLWLFGGVAQLERQPSTWRDELAVAVAGPLVSFGTGGLALGVAGILAATTSAELAVVSLVWFGSTGVLLAVFNLLPGAPLDGGRVFTALRWRHHGDQARARNEGARAGLVMASTLIAAGIVAVFSGWVGLGLWLAFLGWFLSSAARAQLADEQARHFLTGVRMRDVMTPDPVTVPPWMTLETLVTDVLGHVHGTTIPVVDEGRFLGLVTPEHLRRIPPRDWAHTGVGAIATPSSQVAVAAPDEELLVVMERLGVAMRRIVVIDEGQVVGVITPTDLARTLHLAELQDMVRH